MKEKHLTVHCTLTEISDIRIALSNAIDLAPTKETRECYIRTYLTLCNLILDAVEENEA